MADSAASGLRFTQAYLLRGEPASDSLRMRRRLGAYLDHHDGADKQCARAIQIVQGTSVPHRGGYGGYDWPAFFEKAELRDVLDAITTVAKAKRDADRNYGKDHAAAWLNFAGAVLQEENVCYRIEPGGGVRYRVDEEFESNRAASIAALQLPRYRAVLAEFEAAYLALDGQPPNGKAAIRGVFEAIEILFKLVLDGKRVSRLGATEISAHLKPILQQRYAADAAALNAANRMADSFAEWTNGAHQYRHGQKIEEFALPPIGLTLLIISAGAGYLRWLAELDAAKG